MEDMELQRKWVEAIKPKYSMLKFRLPFPEKEVIELLGENVEYLPGIIYKQPWSRGKSIETRLIVSGDNLVPVKYSLSDYEQQMFYHNSVLRRMDYKFPFSEKLDGIVISKFLTINKRYDSAYIITLLNQYFIRSNPDIEEPAIKSRIIKILKMIGQRDTTIKYITN
jgi:hypothetical protein